MRVPVIKAPSLPLITQHNQNMNPSQIDSWCLFQDELKSVLADMSPTLVPSRNILYFCGPLLLYIYFWPRLSRARLGSGVVYVTGQIGLPNSERLTLSNVHTGRQPTWGRGVAGVVGFGSPHGPSVSIQILALSGMALTFTATIMQMPTWPHHRMQFWPFPLSGGLCSTRTRLNFWEVTTEPRVLKKTKERRKPTKKTQRLDELDNLSALWSVINPE